MPPPSAEASLGRCGSSSASDWRGGSKLLHRPPPGEQDGAALASGREHEEARCVVEAVQQAFSVRADERGAKMEASLGERQLVDAEAQAALAAATRPAELGGRLRQPGENDA